MKRKWRGFSHLAGSFSLACKDLSETYNFASIIYKIHKTDLDRGAGSWQNQCTMISKGFWLLGGS